jgi:hypothetical protein
VQIIPNHCADNALFSLFATGAYLTASTNILRAFSRPDMTPLAELGQGRLLMGLASPKIALPLEDERMESK